MAELDRTPPPPARSSSGAGAGGPLQRKVGPFPVWVWLVGVGGVALYMHRRSQAAAAAASGVGTNTDTLSAGAPMDASGAPFGSTGTAATGQTLDQWVAAAFAALIHAGVNPALAEKALSDFVGQNSLNDSEANAISKALGLVGAPPTLLPFYGNIPSSGPTKKPPPVPPTHDPGFRVAPIASFPHVNLLPGEHVVDVLRTSTTGAGYYLTNLGGVFAVGGAPFLGSSFSRPHAAGTQFSQIERNASGGYTLLATNGHTMSFAPAKKAA